MAIEDKAGLKMGECQKKVKALDTKDPPRNK
jgi:hypothetical protein